MDNKTEISSDNLKIKKIQERISLATKNKDKLAKNLKDARDLYNNTYTSDMMKETTNSQIHYPKAFATVDSNVARATQNDPRGSFKIADDKGGKYRPNIIDCNAHFQHIWYQAGMTMKAVQATEASYVDGICIGEVFWHKEVRKRWNRETDSYEDDIFYDAPDYIIKKRENCYLNPFFDTSRSYSKWGEWIIIEDIMSLDEIKAVNDLPNSPIKYINIDELEKWLMRNESKEDGKAPVAKYSSDEFMTDASIARNVSSDNSDKYDSSINKITVQKHYEYNQWVFRVPGFTKPILDQVNPYGDGELPVIVTYVKPSRDSVDGISPLIIGADLFDAMNTLLSQRLDAGMFDMMPMMKTWGLKKTDGLVWEPGGIITLGDKNTQDVEPMQSPDQSSNTFSQEWQYLMSGLDYLGTMDSTKAPDQANAMSATATGVRSSDLERDIRISSIIKNIEETLIKPFAEKCFNLCYRFLTDPVQIEVKDKNSIRFLQNRQQQDIQANLDTPDNQNYQVTRNGATDYKFTYDEGLKTAYLVIEQADYQGKVFFEVDTQVNDSENDFNRVNTYFEALINPTVIGQLEKEGKMPDMGEALNKLGDALSIKNAEDLIKNIEQVQPQATATDQTMGQQAVIPTQQLPVNQIVNGQ